MKKFLFLGLMSAFFFNCQRATSDLAYITNRDGNFNIYLTNIEGSEHIPLTTNAGMDWSPKWNPAKNSILYYSTNAEGIFAILMMDKNGQSIGFDAADLEECILSPDASRALFVRKDNSYNHIYLFDRKAKTTSRIIEHPSYNGRPKWSPDGDAFSFISDRTGTNELYLFQIASKETIKLTDNGLSEKYTSWLSDGTAILYTAQLPEAKNNDIYRVNLKTKEITQITRDEKYYEEICVSPDGKSIAFHGNRDGKHHIYTMDMKGRNEKQITNIDAYHGEPEWIPIIKVK